MLIDEISKGVDQDKLIVDRAFLRVSGCKKRVLLDSNFIPDACSVIEIMAGFIAGKELVLSDGMSGLTEFGRNFISGLYRSKGIGRRLLRSEAASLYFGVLHG